jgi:hypothetical protein
MRQEFLRATPDDRGVSRFLNQWGVWDDQSSMALEEFIGFQKMVHEGLTGSAERWFSRERGFFPYPWSRDLEYPYFVVRTDECRIAIEVTITIDKVRGLKFNLCARGDCRQPFPLESKHKKKCCSWYCGHLESVRRNRKPLGK